MYDPNPTPLLFFTPRREASQPGAYLPAVLRILDTMVSSAEPSVVFTSVVRLCVPAICASATAAITESDDITYTVAWPQAADRAPSAPTRARSNDTVRALIDVPADGGHPGYAGTLTLRFDVPVGADQEALGELIVTHATTVVHRERLIETAVATAMRMANLERALTTNREIGIAMGVLMSTHKLTSGHAFDLLRRVSQHTNRKLNEIAAAVGETGALDLPLGVRLIAG